MPVTNLQSLREIGKRDSLSVQFRMNLGVIQLLSILDLTR